MIDLGTKTLSKLGLRILATGVLMAALTALSGCGAGPTAPANKATIQAIVRGEVNIHHAALQGDTEALSYFVDDGADLDAPDVDGEAPLHYAAASGQVPAVKLLLLAGANPHTVDVQGRTPLQLAEELGEIEAAQALASEIAYR